LAFIDGEGMFFFAPQVEEHFIDMVLFREVDPWRPDTPHSDDAKKRADTILRPFKLIPST
jgi:hypothetical protein